MGEGWTRVAQASHISLIARHVIRGRDFFEGSLSDNI